MKAIVLSFMFVVLFFSPMIAQQKDSFEEKQATFFKEAQMLYPNLKTYQSLHFKINYTMPTVEKYPTTMESFFRFFETTMSVQPDEEFFRGRAEVYFWEKRADYRSFAKKFDEIDATQAGAYFQQTKTGWLRICIPLEPYEGKSALETEAWNIRNLYGVSALAMFSEYLTDTRLPAWLNCGLASYFSIKMLESYHPKIAKYDEFKRTNISILKSKITENKLLSFRFLFHQKKISGNDKDSFAWGWYITCVLMKSYKPQTVMFIKRIKSSFEYRFMEKEKDLENTTSDGEKKVEKVDDAEIIKRKEKILDDLFLECFKIDIDKFGELIHAQLKKNPSALDQL